MRILVVDDHPDLVESMSLVLGMLGHEARAAASGAEALRVLEHWSCELAFVDVGMPVMSGHEVAREIRRRWPDSGPVLVALTGWGGPEDRALALEAGFDRHVVKPVDLETLQALLAEVAATPR